jgi:hypothetical protein
MIVTLKRYCPVGRNYVTRSIGLTPLPMSMSSPTVRATPRDALRGVALSSVSMRPPTASHRADLLPLTPRRATPLGTWHQGACQTAAGPRCGHLSVPIPLGRRPQMPRGARPGGVRGLPQDKCRHPLWLHLQLGQHLVYLPSLCRISLTIVSSSERWLKPWKLMRRRPRPPQM